MYLICQYAINKSQSGYLPPAEFNTLVNQAQVSYLDYLLGEFQQYQPGKATPRVSYSKNEDVRQRIAPLITETTLTINGTGFAAYPADYLQADAVRNPTTFERLRYVQQDNLYSYYNSKIDPIATHPIYLLEKDGFRFYPITLGTTKLTYIKNAPTMTWAYTLDANGRPVYAPTETGASVTPTTGTVQPVWYDVDKLEIVARVLKIVGVSLKDGMVEQYANIVTSQGQ